MLRVRAREERDSEVIVIEQTSVSQIDQLVDLYEHHYKPDLIHMQPPFFFRENAIKIIEGTSRQFGKIFAARRGSKILGFTVAICDRSPYGESLISQLVVERTARQRGIGTELIAMAVQWLRDQPTTKEISIEVDSTDRATTKIAVKAGFIIGPWGGYVLAVHTKPQLSPLETAAALASI